MDAPSYSNPDEWSFESVADPSRGEWTKYTAEEASHDYTFTMTASGTYNYRFFLMDKAVKHVLHARHVQRPGLRPELPFSRRPCERRSGPVQQGDRWFRIRQGPMAA